MHTPNNSKWTRHGTVIPCWGQVYKFMDLTNLIFFEECTCPVCMIFHRLFFVITKRMFGQKPMMFSFSPCAIQTVNAGTLWEQYWSPSNFNHPKWSLGCFTTWCRMLQQHSPSYLLLWNGLKGLMRTLSSTCGTVSLGVWVGNWNQDWQPSMLWPFCVHRRWGFMLINEVSQMIYYVIKLVYS